MDMRNLGVILICIMMAGSNHQPSLYAAAQPSSTSLESLKKDYEMYQQFFLAEGMFSFEKNDDKRYALFFDSFKRFFDRTKAATSPQEVELFVRQLKKVYNAYVSAYAKLLMFMISDKDCGLQSSQNWYLSAEKKRAVLIVVLHRFCNLLFNPEAHVGHSDIIAAVLKGMEEQSGMPSGPSPTKAKLLRSAQDEARMHTLRNQFLKRDILEYDKEVTARSHFAQRCIEQVVSFMRIEQKYTTYQLSKNDTQGRELVEEYESFITNARDPLLQMIGRFGTTMPLLATKAVWDNHDCDAAVLLAMTLVAQKKISTLTSQWQELHTVAQQKEEQKKAYTQARSFGTDSFRASAFEQYTRLKNQSNVSALFNKKTPTDPLRHAFDRYDTIINRYFEKGMLSEADLGELNFAVSTFAPERQKLAQQVSSRTLFKSARKKELHNQIATLDQLTKLSIGIRNASIKGGEVPEHEHVQHAVTTVVALLDIMSDLIKSDPKFVHYIKEAAAGSSGGLSNLVGHVRSFKSVRNIVRLLSLWGDVEKNETLSRVVDIGQDIFKNHLDKIKHINSAFGTQQTVVSTSKDAVEWRQQWENNIMRIQGASFVDPATYTTMLSSVRGVSSFGSPDVGFKISLDHIMEGYHTLLLAAWRENHALQEKLLQAHSKVVATLSPHVERQKTPHTVKKQPYWSQFYSNDPLADLVDDE